MSDYNKLSSPPGASQQVLSRIENDIETLKRFTHRVGVIRDRILKNARALGYYESTPTTNPSQVKPVATSMADVLRELDSAIDDASGSLNVFD